LLQCDFGAAGGSSSQVLGKTASGQGESRQGCLTLPGDPYHIIYILLQKTPNYTFTCN